MCGISLFFSKTRDRSQNLEHSLELIHHRGPDHRGTYFERLGDYYIGLGHNRLSILDLSSAGNQPMHSSEKYSIIFNGEIYNYNELRESLILEGFEFSTKTDTEVVLKLYECYGESCFSLLRGMFVLSIVDRKLNKAFVVRDCIGIKPIYIYQSSDEIIMSSEIKGLKGFDVIDWTISRSDVYEFFSNGFLYEPRTGYEYINKLPPGHKFVLDFDSGEKNIEKYSHISDFRTNEPLDILVSRAVSNQMQSDANLGLFFSGGADSSILAKYIDGDSSLIFAKYADDQSSNVDLAFSSKISNYLKKKLTVVDIDDSQRSPLEMLQQVDFVAAHTEELISDYTFLPTFKLSDSARKSGFKVMLSGMGGDEAFAGYPRYKILPFHNILATLSPCLNFISKYRLYPKKLDKKIDRLVSFSQEKKFPLAYSRLLGYFSAEELKLFFGEKEKDYRKIQIDRMNELLVDCNSRDFVKLAQHLDRFGFLSHNLMVADKASMLASIELRVPLLDESIVEHAYNLEPSKLVNISDTKVPLKNLLSRILPSRLVDRPKTGFNPPLDSLINGIGKSLILQQLQKIHYFLGKDAVVTIVEDHFSKKCNNSYKIWQMLYFSFWLSHSYGSLEK